MVISNNKHTNVFWTMHPKNIEYSYERGLIVVISRRTVARGATYLRGWSGCFTSIEERSTQARKARSKQAEYGRGRSNNRYHRLHFPVEDRFVEISAIGNEVEFPALTDARSFLQKHGVYPSRRSSHFLNIRQIKEKVTHQGPKNSSEVDPPSRDNAKIEKGPRM